MSSQTLEKPKEIGKRMMIAVADLLPNPANRKLARDEEIKTLAQSIKEVGLLHPIIVQHHPEEKGKYLIIAGERRWRAAKRAGFEAIACVLASGGERDASDVQILGVVENHQRKSLSPLEEAATVRQLLDVGLETEAIARSLGRSRAWVSRRSSLTELSETWLTAVKNDESRIASWPASHLEMIARFPDSVQDRLLREWRSQWQWRVPSLSELIQITGECQRMIASAPWKPEDDTLCPQAGACANCPKRSSHHPDLFGDDANGSGKVGSEDRCLDPVCWREKSSAFLKQRIEEAKAEHKYFSLLINSEKADDVEVETEGRPVVFRSAVTLCKKSDKRAMPALVVSGPGLGRIKWVQLPKEPKATSNGAHGQDSNDESEASSSSGEKTLEQKREPFDRRRRQIVIQAVWEKLDALIKVDNHVKALEVEGGKALVAHGMVLKTILLLYLLLSNRGWSDSAHDPMQEPPKELDWNLLSTLKKDGLGSAEVRETVIALCWDLERLCLNTFTGRLSVPSNERENERQYADAGLVCEMLGFDLVSLRAHAAESIPYAKTWREEVEDEWVNKGVVQRSDS